MELIAIVLAVLTGAVYARGARLTRRPMPWWRSALFFSGLVALVLALASGIEILAGDLFSIHMLQHMLLTIVAAPLLMLGAPVRPLLRGLPAVFDIRYKRWVRPELADVAEVIAQVGRCPSGALQIVPKP